MRLAVIGTFYRRPLLYGLIAECISAQTRQPDELWLMHEEASDGAALASHDWGSATTLFVPFRVQRDEYGRPVEVPPSVGINVALDHSRADAFVYLTDDSLPYPEKLELMEGALEENGAVYCSQSYGNVANAEDFIEAWRGQRPGGVREAIHRHASPFCAVDHTQVGHRASPDRWPTEMGHIRFSDGSFFKLLVERFGPLFPVPPIIDWTRQMPDGISAR